MTREPRSGGPAPEPSTSGAVGDVTRVEKYLQLLLALAGDGPPAGVSELARAAGLSRATVYRVLEALAAGDMVRFDAASGRYRIGGKAALALGFAAFERMPVRAIAMPYLYELRDITGETPTLLAIVGHRSAGLEQVVSRLDNRRVSLVGSASSIFAPGPGLGALFAAFDPATERLLREARGSPERLAARDRILARAEQVRADGYDIIEGMHRSNFLALPVFDAEGHASLGVGIVGPPQRWTREAMLRALPECREVVSQLSIEIASSEGGPF